MLTLWQCLGYRVFIAALKIFKNISQYLKFNDIYENHLSNIVEYVDNIMEILYNYDNKCQRQWIILYYALNVFVSP